MPVTLTDEQVADLRRQLAEAETNRQIAEAAAGVWNHPERGDEAKALWKAVYPDSKVPDYDLERKLTARLDAEKKEREERERQQRERETDERIAASRKSVQETYGFTDDAMSRLEKLMVERNVADYEVAASYMASREPRVSDGNTEYDNGFWRHQDDDTFKEISADPEGWGRREILKTLRQADQRNRGGWR